MFRQSAPIRMCEKVEVLGTKDGKERIIAVISMKDGKVVVESNDKAFKKDAENFLSMSGKTLLLTRIDSSGFRQQMLVPQEPGEKYFLCTIAHWWGDKVLNYTNVHGRMAGKIWEEDVPKEWLEK